MKQFSVKLAIVVAIILTIFSESSEALQIRSKRQISKEIICGKKKVKTQGLVLKGYATTPGSWPWHAAIFHIEGIQKMYACGATLINEYQILTAAHCVINQNNGAELFPGSILIQLGAYDLTVNSPNVQEHKATYIDVHENYNHIDHKNDVAIITLATKVRYNKFVQPACIWYRDVNDLSKQGITGTAVGWGITENDKSSPTLKAANLPIVGFHECLQSNREVFGQFLTEDNFCAGYRNGTVVCNGDSGGGLFVYYQKTWYVAGIISFSALRESGSLFCSPKDYGVFVNLPRFKDWIVKERNIGTKFLPLSKIINPVIYRADKNTKLRLADIKCHEYGAKDQAATTKQRFYVSKIQAYQDNTFLSEGHMISEFFFITAADATFLKRPNLAKKATGSPLQIYNVNNVVFHPDYKDGLLDNNLALVKVKEEFKYHGYSRIICLYTSENVNSKDLVTDFADQQINIASNNECDYRKQAIRKFGQTNRTTEFCTDVCLNSELLMKKSGSEYLYLIGLMAECGEEEIEPGIFTNLTPYLDWIESVVWK